MKIEAKYNEEGKYEVKTEFISGERDIVFKVIDTLFWHVNPDKEARPAEDD